MRNGNPHGSAMLICRFTPHPPALGHHRLSGRRVAHSFKSRLSPFPRSQPAPVPVRLPQLQVPLFASSEIPAMPGSSLTPRWNRSGPTLLPTRSTNPPCTGHRVRPHFFNRLQSHVERVLVTVTLQVRRHPPGSPHQRTAPGDEVSRKRLLQAVSAGIPPAHKPRNHPLVACLDATPLSFHSFNRTLRRCWSTSGSAFAATDPGFLYRSSARGAQGSCERSLHIETAGQSHNEPLIVCLGATPLPYPSHTSHSRPSKELHNCAVLQNDL